MPRSRLLLPLLLASLVLLFASSAAADDEIPRVDRIAVDGRLDDAAWSGARVLPVAATSTPSVPPAQGEAPLDLTLKVCESEGRLCFGLEVAEDPSAWIGLILRIAQDSTKSGADAVEIAYRPQSLRAQRFIARGPLGEGRGAYPVEGAAVFNARGRWSLELAVTTQPLADEDAPALRVGAAVLTRTPNLFASSPAGAVFHGPSSWHRFVPKGGVWSTGEDPGTDRLVAEDERDRERLAAWTRFVLANDSFERVPARGGSKAFVRAQFDETLFKALDDVLAARPDLVAGIETIRGDILRQLGLADEALASLDRALEASPGWREARFTKAFTLSLEQWTERSPGKPSDYPAAYEALAAVDAEGDPWRAEAAKAARGLLLFREGRFPEAVAVLDPLARSFPAVRYLVRTQEQARKYLRLFVTEQQERKRDRARTLPRVRVTTNRGAFEAELFQHACPNVVNNFVWLSREGFYDQVAFHRNMPFFALQSGDPFSKPDADGGDPALVGLGGPGYDIFAESSSRMPFRGALAMVHTGSGTLGSQFVVLTGTGAHVEGEVIVFGRVTKGLDVVDALVRGDRIEGIELLYVDENWTYHPADLAGQLPETPRPTAPRPR